MGCVFARDRKEDAQLISDANDVPPVLDQVSNELLT